MSEETKPAASPPAVASSDCSAFSVGGWWLMEYGFTLELFYIWERHGDKIFLSSPKWCVSFGVWMTRKEMQYRKAEYLGHGKRKWYWKFLPWRDFVTPVWGPKRQHQRRQVNL